MGLTGSGFYNIKKQNRCLENRSGNDVSLITCNNHPTTIWYYNKDNRTFCNKHTKNCLENGGSLTANHKVAAYPDDGSPNKKWTYGITGTLCNQQTNFCLENGGASSQGLTVAAYNDDKHLNKKWEIKNAECKKVSEVPSKVVLTPVTNKLICTNTCKSKKGNYIQKYRNAGLKGYCSCEVGTSCT